MKDFLDIGNNKKEMNKLLSLKNVIKGRVKENQNFPSGTDPTRQPPLLKKLKRK